MEKKYMTVKLRNICPFTSANDSPQYVYCWKAKVALGNRVSVVSYSPFKSWYITHCPGFS